MKFQNPIKHEEKKKQKQTDSLLRKLKKAGILNQADIDDIKAGN